MTTGRKIVLFAILLLGLIFLFRLYCLRLKDKYGFRLVYIMYISILFFISFFCYFFRIYLLSRFGLHFYYPFSFFIFSVGGGQALPLPAPSGPSSSSSFSEDSFEIRVLLEPFPETEMEGTSVNSSIPGVARDEAGPSHQPYVVKNCSFESSIRNRVVNLENDQTLFLLDKGPGEYWSEIKAELDQAHSQSEYNLLLEFENRNLQIRELKHACYSLFQQVLSEHPALAENACYNPKEALIDFFDEKRDELDTNPAWSTAEKHREELQFLGRVGQDFRERGRDSPYIKIILGLE